MQEVRVELGTRGYPVLVGNGLLADAGALTPALGAASLVVTSETVAGLHLETLRSALAGHRHAVLVLDDGEDVKRLATVERIAAAAIEAGLGRDATLIALGGGAIGDVTGLAAALYHRGIGVVHAPTTLLAQVDSAVGGKTAVNHPLGKNLLGAFHQPRRVVCDVATLATLPARELRAGLAEVIKYALLEGEPLLGWLEAQLAALLAGDRAALEDAVVRCCRIKARFVAADETDRGERALLNLGHTFGHAVESAYAGRLLHGEAVALGCVMAARMSQALGRLDARACARVLALFAAAGLPVALPAPAPDADQLLERMQRDKKAAAGVLRLVLLRGLGEAELTADYPHALLVMTLRDFTMAR